MRAKIKVRWVVLFTAFAIFLTTTQLQAQVQEPSSTVQKSIQTPSVASLGKYGDIPVNLYTGTPNISVPLYTLNTSIVDLPLSISYHASGIRVDDKAGIVGLGWSLNAGGVITRTVQGFPDDTFNNAPGGGDVDVVNTYSENIFNAWETVEKVLGGYELNQNLPDSLQDLLYLINKPVIGGTSNSQFEYDTKPDIFTFNFAGKTGKFLLPNDFHEASSGELPLIPYQNLTIKWEKSAQTLTEFEITEDDGTIYTFDKIEEVTVERASLGTGTWNLNGGYSEEYNTSWFLTKIEAPNSSEVITFEYTPHLKERRTPGSVTVLQSELATNQLTGAKQQFIFDSFLLDKITTERETVEFIYNDTDLLYSQHGITLSNKTLGEVVIRRADNTGVKKWDFSYDYFLSENDTEPNLSGAARESKLVAVQEMSVSGSDSNPPYEFEYLNDSSHRLPMNFDIEPSNWEDYFENAAVDYWGFYNGKTTNNVNNFEHDQERLRIPDIGSRIFDPPGWNFINMEPDENYILNGIIKRVTYPTGGHTEFDFEIHDYSWIGNESLYDLIPESEINPNPTYTVGNNQDNGTVTFEIEQNSIGFLDFSVRLHNPSQPEENEGFGSVSIERVSPNPGHIVTLTATVEPGMISDSESADSLSLAAGVYQMENDLSFGSPDIYGLTSYLSFSEPVEIYEGSRNVAMFSVEQMTEQLGIAKPRMTADLDSLQNKKGGGVRIKRITTYADSNDTNPIIRHFTYKELDPDGVASQRSSGVLVRPTQFLKQSTICELSLDYCWLVQRIESSSFLPLGITHGSNVGYREVTELLGENGEFGKIRHIYSSPVEVPDLFKKVYDRGFLAKNVAIFSQDWARGNEIKTEHYNASGQLKYAVEREYELNVLSNPGNMYPGVGVRSFITDVASEKQGGEISSTSLELYYATVTVNTTGRSKLVKETKTFFDEAGSQEMTTTKQFSYLEPSLELSLPRQIIEINSDNTQRITRYRYAHEVTDDGTGIDYRPMLDLNMHAQPHSVTVMDSLGQVLKKRWTLWSDSTGTWRPRGVWEWTEGDDTNPVFNYQN